MYYENKILTYRMHIPVLESETPGFESFPVVAVGAVISMVTFIVVVGVVGSIYVDRESVV